VTVDLIQMMMIMYVCMYDDDDDVCMYDDDDYVCMYDDDDDDDDDDTFEPSSSLPSTGKQDWVSKCDKDLK
jgi:hypothetical protein